MRDDDDIFPRSESNSDSKEQLDINPDSSAQQQDPAPRREPVFSGFDDDDDYEEPERDTDYSSTYVDDELELQDDLNLQDDPHRELEGAKDYLEPDEEELPDYSDSEESDPWPVAAAEDDWQVTEEAADETSYEENEDDALDGVEEDWQEEYLPESTSWPLGLIAVAILAIVLLAAGGYGVMQQRSATQEEIRQLRAQLATAAQPAEVSTTRNDLRDAKQRNIEMAVAMESLKLENRRLSDTVAGLEAQLDAQQKALAKAKPAPAPKASPVKAAPVASKPAATTSSAGNWFVNFGSYSQREPAQDWASKLSPDSGRAVVTTGSKDGKTFYRVRVIDLPNRDSAEKMARQLEIQHGLSKLWVGKQ